MNTGWRFWLGMPQVRTRVLYCRISSQIVRIVLDIRMVVAYYHGVASRSRHTEMSCPGEKQVAKRRMSEGWILAPPQLRPLNVCSVYWPGRVSWARGWK